MGADEREESEGSLARHGWLLVLVAALLPSLGTLQAPWLAEDAAALARVAEDGAWADWNRPWFGMEIVRFWRPLVTCSWGVQYALTGVEPLFLRLFNLLLHAGTALCAWGILRRLGGAPLAALVAGLWVAWFPEQGGTVTWLSGRTDLLCGFFLLASVHAALGSRAWSALPLAFLAAAAKEFGFLAPAWCALFAWARGERPGACLRRALPAFLAVALACGWRAFALGTLAGGYAGGLPAPLSALAGIPRALFALPNVQCASFLLLAVLILGRLLGAPSWRTLGALLGAALVALVPLGPLLADGVLEPQNARLLFVPFLALACLAGACLGRLSLTPRTAPALVLSAALAPLARQDTREWRAAAEESARRIEAARAAVAPLERGDAPALSRDFPASLAGAYALSFGVAQRFQAPFAPAQRPVWPWRLLFVADPARERAPLVAERAGGLLLPLDDGPARPPLALTASGAPVAALRADERTLPRGEDDSLRLELSGAPGGATLEFVLYTELGYEPFPAGAADPEGCARFTLRELLQSSNGVAPALQALAQAHDLGARRAYVECRALEADGSVAAASHWTELTWPADLASR